MSPSNKRRLEAMLEHATKLAMKEIQDDCEHTNFEMLGTHKVCRDCDKFLI